MQGCSPPPNLCAAHHSSTSTSCSISNSAGTFPGQLAQGRVGPANPLTKQQLPATQAHASGTAQYDGDETGRHCPVEETAHLLVRGSPGLQDEYPLSAARKPSDSQAPSSSAPSSSAPPTGSPGSRSSSRTNSCQRITLRVLLLLAVYRLVGAIIVGMAVGEAMVVVFGLLDYHPPRRRHHWGPAPAPSDGQDSPQLELAEQPAPASRPASALRTLHWLAVCAALYLLLIAACKACMQALAGAAWKLYSMQASARSCAIGRGRDRAQAGAQQEAAAGARFHALTAGWLRGKLKLWECVLPLLVLIPVLPLLALAPFFYVVGFVAAPAYLLLPLAVTVYHVRSAPPLVNAPRTILGYPEVWAALSLCLARLWQGLCRFVSKFISRDLGCCLAATTAAAPAIIMHRAALRQCSSERCSFPGLAFC
jgi:hypothetical protein